MAAADRIVASWDFPRSGVTSCHLLDTARAHGIDAAAVLAGTGLTVRKLADPAAEVQAGQELAIVRNLVRLVDDPPAIAVESGLRYSLPSSGILGYALLTSPTFRDAIPIVHRFVTLSSTFLDVSVHETELAVVVALDATRLPADVRGFLLNRDVAAIAHLVPLLLGARDTGVPIEIDVGTADFPLDVLTLPGLTATVEHHAPCALLKIPIELVDRPMPAADPDTAAKCIAQCEELLERRSHRGGLSAQLRARLLEHPAQMPTMAVLARELAVTERTLHRRLAEENISYRALVSEVRETIAVELLGNGLTVEEVAHRLGYAETAAFTHAFTRWRGHPPSRLSRG